MALYRHTSVFVYTSLYEGFGIPPLEAMMCGCLVVVSDIEVFYEVYGDSVEYCDFKDERLWMRVLKEVIEYTNCKKIDSDIICNKYNWNKTVYIFQNVIFSK